MFLVENLILLSSIKRVDEGALVGMKSLKNLYYCGNNQPSGNVFATSAVIGGAIKGDIDVNGPVIVDSTAIVKGNIKSKSVQINNGAVIDGFCSQAYAEIDYKSLFEDTFATK